MDNIKLLPIDNSNVENCHALNEDNVPNVGTTTFEEFKALVENSDFHRCITVSYTHLTLPTKA